MKALSIRQPWAFAITHGRKDVENRTWATSFRGRILLHASATMTRDDVDGFRDFIKDNRDLGGDWLNTRSLPDLQRGGIVGIASIVDCVAHSRSLWFVGPFGFVLTDVVPLTFTPCKGALGFFAVPADVVAQVEAETLV